MEKQPVSQLLFYLRIKIQEAKIIINKEAFHDPDMLIGWRIKNLAAMKIIVAVVILVQGLQQVLLQQALLQKN